MNAIKGIQGKDGPLLMDFGGVANVPGAVKSIADLKAKVGDHFEVDTVCPDGTIQTVRAVEKPAGSADSGQNAHGIPGGGRSGQVLTKISDDDYDAEWRDPVIPEQYGLVTYDQDQTITIT